MIWVFIVLVAFLLDRLSKIWVMNTLVGNPITVIEDFFYLRHLENKGAAFSIFHGKTFFLVLLSLIVSIVLIYFMIKFKDKFLRVSISVVLGGAIGNLYDRLFNDGSVIDFLEFHFGSYVFPTFNVADIFVVCGTILLGVYILFFYKEEENTAKTVTVNTDVNNTKAAVVIESTEPAPEDVESSEAKADAENVQPTTNEKDTDK